MNLFKFGIKMLTKGCTKSWEHYKNFDINYVVYDGSVYYSYVPQRKEWMELGYIADYNSPFRDTLIDIEIKTMTDVGVEVRYMCTRCKHVSITKEDMFAGLGCSTCLDQQE